MADPLVITILRQKRAEVAGQIAALEKDIRARRVDLEHVDATLRLFAPGMDMDGISAARQRSLTSVGEVDVESTLIAEDAVRVRRAFGIVGHVGQLDLDFVRTSVEAQLIGTVSGASRIVGAPPTAGRDRRLAELLSVRQNMTRHWTAEDGIVPNSLAFRDAATFITLIPPLAPEPSIFVSGDGEVGFSWSLTDAFVEVAFRGDDQIRYAFRFGKPVHGDEVPFRFGASILVPVDLMTALSQM